MLGFTSSDAACRCPNNVKPLELLLDKLRIAPLQIAATKQWEARYVC